MPEATAEILRLARLYLEEDEVERLVVWIANRIGRNQDFAGGWGPRGRPERVLRHWLVDEERQSLARWMLSQAAERGPIVPARPVGLPSDGRARRRRASVSYAGPLLRMQHTPTIGLQRGEQS